MITSNEIRYYITFTLAMLVVSLSVFFLSLFSVFVHMPEPFASALIGVYSGIATGFIVVLWTIPYTFDTQFKMKYLNYHSRLKNEIKYNIQKIFEFENDVLKCQKIWLDPHNKTPKWLPKCTSVVPNRKHSHDYLTMNAYHYFVSLEDFSLNYGRLERLNLFYALCKKFNDQTQDIEDKIDEYRRNHGDDDISYKVFIDDRCGELLDKLDYYKWRIVDECQHLGVEDICEIEDPNTYRKTDPEWHYKCPEQK
jgi:hypothetical protein